jgi:hypothetical protein
VRAGDTSSNLPTTRSTRFAAARSGLDYLVFGTRHPVEYGWLPRSQAIRLSWPWVEGRVDDPWDVEAEVGELEFAEPASARRTSSRSTTSRSTRTATRLSPSGRSEISGLELDPPRPGPSRLRPALPLLESEAFVVLDGGGRLELWPTPRSAGAARLSASPRAARGHVVARPPGRDRPFDRRAA